MRKMQKYRGREKKTLTNINGIACTNYPSLLFYYKYDVIRAFPDEIRLISHKCLLRLTT